MADAVTTDEDPRPRATPRPTSRRSAPLSPIGEVLRDIARGGIAGIIVGIFVAGLGGRLVMRLATILHEDTVGRVTENGEVIGRDHVQRDDGADHFGGLGHGLMAGDIWVIVRPVAARAAAAAGPSSRARSRSRSGHPPSSSERTRTSSSWPTTRVVVAMLVGLVFAVGFSIALVDGWLDRRLPQAVRGVGVATTAYLVDHVARPVPHRAARGRDPARPARLPRADPGRLRARDRRRLHARRGGSCESSGQTSPPRWLTLTGRSALVTRRARGHDEPAAHPRRHGDALVIRGVGWVAGHDRGTGRRWVRPPLPG